MTFLSAIGFENGSFKCFLLSKFSVILIAYLDKPERNWTPVTLKYNAPKIAHKLKTQSAILSQGTQPLRPRHGE
jgi:hypothetical protein